MLFTSPGERVMRPDFGSGLLALVFEPNSTALAATTQMLVQGALQQHLGDLIAVQAVEVEAVDGTLRVEVRYSVLGDGTAQLASFAAAGRCAVIFHCCELRRLEVLRRSAPPRTPSSSSRCSITRRRRASPPQRTLFVRLLRAPPVLTAANLRISGGERIPTVGIEWVAPATPCRRRRSRDSSTDIDDLPRTLVVRTDLERRFLALHASLIVAKPRQQPAARRLRSAARRDRLLVQGGVPVGLRLRRAARLPAGAGETPRIDYLAKDYEGFRRLMLDRLSLLAPGWRERSAADLGVALVELLAYAADNLSYRQDAIANEAYLNTARQRISVRRHARPGRLLPARGLQCARLRPLRTSTPKRATHLLPARTRLFTQVPDVDPR